MTTLTNFTWVGGASGSFDLAPNWSPAAVPSYGTIGVPSGTTIILPASGTVNLNGLLITGSAGTVTFSGGSLIFNNGLSPATGYNVTLSNTTFSTSAALGAIGGGSITLNGATVTGSGSAAAGVFVFDSVTSGGALIFSMSRRKVPG